ncbi:CIA30 family protein [Neobacillus drentensis]|uniref:glycosyl hydrolase n=1 Tax=Neobacillus drentensis TaxID=220684 RepID=UPI001F43E648|nr:glycosyl hydrolase [Neobacillus drentensis]ULT56182.1 CIA30 family protein [Neobacillus drentensis]
MKELRKSVSLLLSVLLLFTLAIPVFAKEETEITNKKHAASPIDLVDRKATDKTKSLFTYLQNVRGNAVLFGHQHATTEGATITTQDGTQSDVKNAVGDFPALYGWDTLSLEGKEKPGQWGGTEQANKDALIKVMKKAYDRGGVLTLSSHMPNFVTGGSFYDTTGNVVSHILPGGDKNEEFNHFLDMIADFAHNLKDDQGNTIPVIFRPFHENNGSWFWWGAAFTTPAQYKELYRYTVEYLRDKKDVRNFLYAFSPGSPFNNDESKYLLTCPGDDYVDILGFDTYNNGEGTDLWLKQVVQDASLISKIADVKGKVAAFTEFGYSNMKVTGNNDTQWFTRLLNALKSDPDAKRMAYMLTWANFSPEGAFTPFKNQQTYGDHELLPDFINYYKDSYTAFNSDIQGVYDFKINTTKEKGFIHTASPTDKETIKTESTTIRVRAVNQPVSKVVYSVEGISGEHELTYNSDVNYYTADWRPLPSQNGKSVVLNVKAYLGNRVVYEEPITVKVEAKDILVKSYDFDSSIAGVESLGTYPDSISMSIEHSKWLDHGAIKLNVNIPDEKQSWQELKLKLNQLDLHEVNKLNYDVYLPVSGNENASIQGIANVPPNWSDKYGMDQAKTLSSLEKVTVGDTVYGKYTAAIDLSPSKELASSSGLAFSIVTSNLKYNGPIYIDNVQLLNSYVESVQDPLVIDSFDTYNGNNSKLEAKYTIASQGDPVKVSLDSTHKSSGDFGLKYEYNLGGSGYGGVTKMLGGVDWSGQNTLKFWYTPDGHDQKLVIQVKANDIAFEAYSTLAGTEPQLIEIPFSEFTVASWDTSHAGSKLDAINTKKVQEFSIYVNAKQPGTQLSSVLYFDDICVTNN